MVWALSWSSDNEWTGSSSERCALLTIKMHQLLNCVVTFREGMDLARLCFPSLSESLRHNQVFHDKLGEITSPLCISFLLGKTVV